MKNYEKLGRDVEKALDQKPPGEVSDGVHRMFDELVVFAEEGNSYHSKAMILGAAQYYLDNKLYPDYEEIKRLNKEGFSEEEEMTEKEVMAKIIEAFALKNQLHAAMELTNRLAAMVPEDYKKKFKDEV